MKRFLLLLALAACGAPPVPYKGEPICGCEREGEVRLGSYCAVVESCGNDGCRYFCAWRSP